MRAKDFAQLVSSAAETPKDSPSILVTSSPGIGKSAICREVAEHHGIGFVDIRLAQRDPTDLRGIPVPTTVYRSICPQGHETEFSDINKPPAKCHCGAEGLKVHRDDVARWIPPKELPTGGKGIMLFDEITSAPPLVQASAYQFFLDRKIGEYDVPDGWYLLAAGNRMEDRAIVHKMSTALQNRFIHITLDENVEDWVRWALSPKGFDAKTGNPIPRDIEPSIIGFLKFSPKFLCLFDPKSSEAAFPTPRSWEFASKMIKITRKGNLGEVLEGTIGKGATAEYLAFRKLENELPSIDEILNGKDIVPDRNDLKYALTSAIVSRAAKKQFNRVIEYSEKLPEEFGVLMVQMLVARDEGEVALCQAFPKWAKTHADVILARKML